MIEIRINGNIERIEDDSTLDSYLQILGLQDRKAIAIALNGEVIPREQFSQTKISVGDSLEIVRAIGGG
ncbi:MAG: sulfur carrier protein ThiS [Dehalococcoidia bacterium]